MSSNLISTSLGPGTLKQGVILSRERDFLDVKNPMDKPLNSFDYYTGVKSSILFLSLIINYKQNNYDDSRRSKEVH